MTLYYKDHYEHHDDFIQESVRKVLTAFELNEWDIELNQAQTGTIYATVKKSVSADDYRFLAKSVKNETDTTIESDIEFDLCEYENKLFFEAKIRFANHSECYCSEDISIDPQGLAADKALSRFGLEW